MNSNSADSIGVVEDAHAEEAAYQEILAEHNRPNRKTRRMYMTMLRHNDGVPGDEKFRRGTRSEGKQQARRLFEARRAIEAEARTRGYRSNAPGKNKPRWTINKEWFPG